MLRQFDPAHRAPGHSRLGVVVARIVLWLSLNNGVGELVLVFLSRSRGTLVQAFCENTQERHIEKTKPRKVFQALRDFLGGKLGGDEGD